MQFIVMAYVREGDWPQLTREQQVQGLAAYKAWTDAMKQAGVFVSSNGLAPGSNGTTLRQGPDGKIQHIFEKVKPEGHAEEVLEYLKQSAKGAA